MMKSVLIAIRTQWCEKIASGEKTIEVRKTAPQEVPFKCYIYETKGRTETPWVDEDGHFIYKGRGQVIGEFICDKVDEYNFHNGLTEFNSMGLPSRIYGSYLIFTDDYKSMCLSYDEVKNYGRGKTLYGWHISDFKIYDKPRELSEFSRPCSYSGLCFSCKRTSFKKDGNLLCNTKITRPPQSWMRVEDLGEEK